MVQVFSSLVVNIPDSTSSLLVSRTDCHDLIQNTQISDSSFDILAHPQTGAALVVHFPPSGHPLVATPGSGAHPVTRVLKGFSGAPDHVFGAIDAGEASLVGFSGHHESRWSLSRGTLEAGAHSASAEWLERLSDTNLKPLMAVPFGTFHILTIPTKPPTLALSVFSDRHGRAFKAWDAPAATPSSEWQLYTAFGGNATHVGVVQTWRPRTEGKKVQRLVFAVPVADLVRGLPHRGTLPPPGATPAWKESVENDDGENVLAVMLTANGFILQFSTFCELHDWSHHHTRLPYPSPLLTAPGPWHSLARGDLAIADRFSRTLTLLRIVAPDVDLLGRPVRSSRLPTARTAANLVPAVLTCVVGLIGLFAAIMFALGSDITNQHISARVAPEETRMLPAPQETNSTDSDPFVSSDLDDVLG